ADPQMALRHARDLYTRRNEGVSIWVVAAADITASSPDEKDPFFAPSGDKVYRHPTFYTIPADVPHMKAILSDEDEFSAYQSLAEETEDHRWAFGTGFTDPLAGIDTSVPDGVDAGALAAYCLMLGDDALVYSHRLQQWMTRMPELEEETALANIALDLLGQARMLLARAGQAEGRGRDEDRLAFFRDEHEFRNVRLVEPADDDFAELVGRLLVFSSWRLALFTPLAGPAAPARP